MKNSLSIIILNYKNWGVTINCLKSIKKNILHPTKIILIDNGSKNESVLKLSNFLNENYKRFIEIDNKHLSSILNKKFDVLFIKLSTNIGYACGNNIGLKISEKLKLKYSLVLNSDILIKEDFLPVFIEKIQNDYKCSIITPIIENENGKVDLNCLRKRRSIPKTIFWNHGLFRPLFRFFLSNKYFFHEIDANNRFCKISVPSGSCLFIDLSWFKSVKYFDENTFLYEEEHILYEKVIKSKKHVLLCTSSYVKHLGGKSSSENSINEKRNIFFDSLNIYLTKYRKINKFYSSLIILYIKYSEKFISILK